MAKKHIRAKNHTVRIGKDFFKEMESIQNKRLKLKRDLKKKSIRVLTNLLIKHDDWETIREDLIEIKLGDNKNE